MKKYIQLLPEIIIILLATYWFLDSEHINYFAVIVFIAVLIQLFIKNKWLGFVLASFSFLFSLFLTLAVLSEFSEFTIINSSAIKLIFTGLIICLLLFSSSIVLFYKSISKPF